MDEQSGESKQRGVIGESKIEKLDHNLTNSRML